MADFPDIPPGRGIPLTILATNLLAGPVQDALDARYASSGAVGSSIPRTLARLRDGQTLTVGVFGDSKMDPTTLGNAAGDATAKAMDLLTWSSSTITIVNAAKSGHTAFRQSLPGYLDVLVAAEPDLVVFEIGTNDSNSDEYGNYAAGYPMPASLAAVERACAYLRDANESCEFMFVGTTPYLPPASSTSNLKIQDYNAGILALAATVGAEYVDGFGAFVDYGDWTPLMLDSTHRDADGNDVLAAAMAEHFPEDSRGPLPSLAPRAVHGRYGISDFAKSVGSFSFLEIAASSSSSYGSYALTGTGWTVSEIFDVSSTVGDAFVLTGTNARELHANVDLNDVAGGAGAVVDVYLDGVLQEADVDLHAQSSKNSTNYWVPFVTGLDGATHALRLVVKAGTLRIASSAIAVAADSTSSVNDMTRTVNVAYGAVTTSLTTSYQTLLAATSIPLPAGWLGMDVQLTGGLTWRTSAATTAVRRIDAALRESTVSVEDTKQAGVPLVATRYLGEIRFGGLKKGLTAAASIDLIAKVDVATDLIQALSWRVDAILVRTA